jgi:hypothetical protein
LPALSSQIKLTIKVAFGGERVKENMRSRRGSMGRIASGGGLGTVGGMRSRGRMGRVDVIRGGGWIRKMAWRLVERWVRAVAASEAWRSIR